MRRRRMRWLLPLWIAGLAGCTPVPDPSVGLSVEQSAALIDQAPRSERTSKELAEAFALNSRATDVQRDMLATDIVGRAVEWDLTVYEVEFSEGRFKICGSDATAAHAKCATFLGCPKEATKCSDTLTALETRDLPQPSHP